jgi:hypothetical protein
MALEIPSGTNTVMKVSTAPTGWVKTNTFNLNVFRVVTGSVVNGGSVDYSSVFVSHTTTVTSVSGQAGGTSLTAPQLPLHTHHTPFNSTTRRMQIPGPGLAGVRTGPGGTPGVPSGFVGTSSPHSHSATVTSGNVSAPTNIDLRVKYVDAIIVQRS